MKWIRTTILATMLVTVPLASHAGLKEWMISLGAVVGAGASAAVGLPPLGVAAGSALGAAVPAVTIPDTDDGEITVEVLEAVPEAERAGVLKAHAFWETVEALGMKILWVVAGFFFIPMILGYFIPRRKEVRQKKEMIKIKEMLFDRPEITMKDLK